VTERASEPLDFPGAPEGGSVRPMREVGEVLERLVAALDDAEAALGECATPLYLDSSVEFLGRFGAGVRALAGELADVASIVEGDLPVAASMPGKNQHWFFRNGSARDALSPKQLVAVREALRADSSQESVSYLSVLRGAAVVSGGRDRDQEWVRSEASEAAAALRLEILADVESRPCPRCEAAPGFLCRAESGLVSGPHAARRNLSPVAAEHALVAKSLRRWDWEAAEVEGTNS
jgi:hypothetical protein